MRLLLGIGLLLAVLACSEEKVINKPPECERYDQDAYQCFLADRVCYIYNLHPGRERVVCGPSHR